MDQIQRNLDRTLSTLEHGFNIAGYIPILSSGSGVLRAVLGKIEVIGAIAVAALIAVKALFNPDAYARDAEIKKAVEVLVTYSLHGVANIFRGIIEIVPLLSLATCLPYDISGNRFTYPLEVQPGSWRDRLTTLFQ